MPVDQFTVGELFAVLGTNPCGLCHQCQIGRSTICTGSHTPIGIGCDGGFAEFVKVRFENVVRVPSGVSAKAACAATDALLTPYHGIKTVAKLCEGERVVVIGLGGVGMNAFLISKLLGGRVYVTDIKAEALEIASCSGATLALPSEDLESDLKSTLITLVIDCVGRRSTFDLAQRIVSPGGRILLLGLQRQALKGQVPQTWERKLNC